MTGFQKNIAIKMSNLIFIFLVCFVFDDEDDESSLLVIHVDRAKERAESAHNIKILLLLTSIAVNSDMGQHCMLTNIGLRDAFHNNANALC